MATLIKLTFFGMASSEGREQGDNRGYKHASTLNIGLKQIQMKRVIKLVIFMYIILERV